MAMRTGIDGSISASVVWRSTPSSSMATSKLVPPMSIETRLANPACAPIRWAATTAAAGPDTNVSIGKRQAEPAVMTPPFDFMISMSRPAAPPNPRSVRPERSRPI